MVFVDFHCHLQHPLFSKGIHRIVERMGKKNVVAINTGFNIEGNEKTFEQCARYSKRLYPAIGLSPHDVLKTDVEKELEYVEKNAAKAIAVGEIGLDFHYFKQPEEQKKLEKAFAAQLEIAERLGKPVVVHSRDAEEKTIEILSSYEMPRVLHFFLLPKLLGKALDAGLYVSVPTLKSKDQKKMFADVPLEKLFLETDSPYGTNTGQRNEPSNVIASYERLAEIRKTPLKEIALMLFGNFKTVTGKKAV
ncbi:MAG: TatD family hydrolase [Candidatus Micrarchaeota archaeon]